MAILSGDESHLNEFLRTRVTRKMIDQCLCLLLKSVCQDCEYTCGLWERTTGKTIYEKGIN